MKTDMTMPKDIKQQVLEDLMLFLEDRASEKLKGPGSDDETPTEDKAEGGLDETDEAAGIALVLSPEESEESAETAEEDDLAKRLMELLAKNGG